ncbi:hypothetical protein [Arthrobacter sp. H14]|uniref:hypothetical protein n=1 Tax=Arthrobacter sp. H14 TaxID=1312959 RepID=UPI000479F62D|nr:hypothetical protein [Arthrobacter sp. H14]
MPHDFEDQDHKSFISLKDSRPFDAADVSGSSGSGTVISQAALSLHAYATVTSLCEGNFGYVPDNYLSSIHAETDLTALELVMAGLWERAANGYLIQDPRMLELAVQADKHVRQSHQLENHRANHTDCGVHITKRPVRVYGISQSLADKLVLILPGRKQRYSRRFRIRLFRDR